LSRVLGIAGLLGTMGERLVSGAKKLMPNVLPTIVSTELKV
jgi:hypothetical protein